MSVTVALINMKGGVGKTTLAFNLAWYSAFKKNLRVLTIDLDPQANMSQYFMGGAKYVDYLESGKLTVYEIFEQFSSPKNGKGSATPINPDDLIFHVSNWTDGSLIDLIPSRLELSWTLKNPTDKSQLLPQFLSKISNNYDLILIDCPPTDSMLTTAAYRASRYVVVPVRPEFLAAIGLPLLARSIDDFKNMHTNQDLDMAGIIFNGLERTNKSAEHKNSVKDVKLLAKKYNWKIFDQANHHSNSYPAGSRKSTPIFNTSYARGEIQSEFGALASEFLKKVGLS